MYKSSVNFPLKGVNKDMHRSAISSDTATTAMNVRVVGADGDNMVIVNINGNRDMFSLPQGYYPIMLKSYNDILYVVSRNNNGVVEIGSYPSPKCVVYDAEYSYGDITYQRYTHNDSLEGFDMAYKPLLCFKHGNDLLGMRTAKFGYSMSPVNIEFKKSFDDTVNMYIANGENVNRVVNSGFDSDGTLRLRQVSIPLSDNIERCVMTYTQHFLAMSKPPQGRLQEVSFGGELPCGNLFLYARYLDYEYNKTNFMPLEGPVLIAHGDDPYVIHGSNPERQYDISDKQMTVKVRYVDHSFKYMEIAVVRHTGNSNIALAPKCMLLNKRIIVPNDSDEIDIVITGKEAFQDISFEEVIRPVMKEQTNLFSSPLNNRLWGINWKESSYDRDAMAALARRVFGVPTLNNRARMYNGNGSAMQDYRYYNKGNVDVTKKSWYQDSFQVLDNVGYFRGEIYPFAVVGLKTDGSLTEAYPITGYDNYVFGNGFNDIRTEWSTDEEAIAYLDDQDNTKCGFIRMPQCGTGDMSEVGSYIDNMDYTVMCNLQIKYAIQYFEEHPELFENIQGFYVVRGDRFKNLVTHGIMYGTYNNITSNVGTNYEALSVFGVPTASGMYSEEEQQIAVNIPLIPNRESSFNSSSKGWLPMITNVVDENYAAHAGPAISSNNKRALFSPDVAFAKNSIVESTIDHHLYCPYTNNLELKEETYPHWLCRSSHVYGSYLNYPNGRMAVDGFILASIASGSDLIYKNNYDVPPFGSQKIYGKLLHNHTNSAKKASYNPYIKVSATFVPSNTFTTTGKFSSKMQDIVLGENMNPGFKSWFTDGDEKKYIGNKDIRTPNYLGLDIAPGEVWPGDFIYWKGITFPFMLYKTANTYYGSGQNYYDYIVSLYNGDRSNMSSIMYYLNNLFVDFAVNRTRVGKTLPDDVYVDMNKNGIYLPGDCFINRYFFRMIYNGESYSFEETDASDSYKRTYDHGSIVSIPLMSEINVSVRGMGTVGFYPNWAKDGLASDTDDSITKYAAYGGGPNRILGEDHIYDYGHSVTLPQYMVPGIDNTIHEHTLHYPNRIRYTDEHITGAYVDGWRVMFYNSRQDFSAELGDMVAMAGYMNYPIAICENAIIQLDIDLKARQTDSITGMEVLLGSGTIISKNFRKLSVFGSQHSSVIVGYNGIYGYDHKRSIIWGISLKAGTNTMYLAAESLSDNVITSYITNKRLLFGEFENSPIGKVKSGVSMVFDETNKEVLFTISNRKHITSNIDENGHITFPGYDVNSITWPGYATMYVDSSYVNVEITNIGDGYIEVDAAVPNERVFLVDIGFTVVYSELLKGFFERSFKPSLYAFYNGAIVMYDGLFDVDRGKVLSGDNNASMCQFWGFNDGFNLGIVLNASKDGLEKRHKMASDMEFPSDEEPLSKLELRSEFQYGEMFPFVDINRFWNLPEYSENTWKTSFPVQSSGADEGYEEEAQMRGTWIEIMMKYSGVKKKYIGAITLNYIVSFN